MELVTIEHRQAHPPAISKDKNGESISWPGLLGVALISMLFYLPALRGELVWDDLPLVGTNLYGTQNLHSAFTMPFGHYYRPLTAAVFAIQNGLAHGTPFLYHLTNIVLHVLASVLVAILAFQVFRKNLVAILAGLFLAVQPAQVGATAWVGGLTDALTVPLLAGFMFVLVRYQEQPKVALAVQWAVLLLLAGLSKEQALAIIPIVPLSNFVFGSRKLKDAILSSVPILGVLIVYGLLWSVCRQIPPLSNTTFGESLELCLRSLVHYTAGFVFPNYRYLLTYTLEAYRSFAWMPIGGVVGILLVYLLKGAWRYDPRLTFLGISALLVYLPISNLPAVSSFVLAPYRSSEAGVGIACLCGYGMATLWIQGQKLWASLFAINLGASAWVTILGVHVWATQVGLFEALHANDSHFMIGTQVYSDILNHQGKFQESAELTDQYLVWLFDDNQWANRILTKRQNAIDDFVTNRLKVTTGKPNPIELGNFLAGNAFSYAKAGNRAKAIEATQCAMIFIPKAAYVYFLYGQLILPENRDEAIRAWETVLRLDPKYDACSVALGHQRVLEQRFAEAIQLIQQGLRTLDYDGPAWVDLAKSEVAMKDFANAKMALKKAKASRLQPKIADVRELERELALR